MTKLEMLAEDLKQAAFSCEVAEKDLLGEVFDAVDADETKRLVRALKTSGFTEMSEVVEQLAANRKWHRAATEAYLTEFNKAGA